MVKNAIFLGLALLCFECKTPTLVTPLKPLNTNLKLNGYYVRKFIDKVNGDKLSNAIFIYSNGVFLNTFSQVTHSDSELQNNYLKKIVENPRIYGDNIYNWGIISIQNNEILKESWYAVPQLPVYIKKGRIINDSTFILTTLITKKGKKTEGIEERFEFKKFSPKPDSTNNFIK